MSFSTTATLEVFHLGAGHPGPAGGVNVVNKIGCESQSHERFHRMAWGSIGSGESEQYPFGIVAGGLVDGSVSLWNPSAMLSPDANDGGAGALICPLKKHVGAVKGLQFNPFSSNLLASGAADSDVCIWDVASPAKPSLFPALKQSGGSAPGGEITHLAWNGKVQHILASTSSTGNTVVWDLKRQRQVISFSDPSGSRRCSALQWNPEVATQLIVASDDDQQPKLQVWDLRNSISPYKEFVGHHKGVLSLAWCNLDSRFLLSSGKDNRTLCWDTTTGEVLCEMPASQNWNFDVQWCPTVPGWFSTASFDGVVSVYDLTQCMSQPAQGSDGHFGQARGLSYAPNWLGRPSGVACGFGGKVVSFAKKQAPAGAPQPPSSVVSFSSMSADDSLVAYTKDLTALVSDPSKPTMITHCSNKKQTSVTEIEQEMWQFLRFVFEDDAKAKILEHLGYKTKAAAEGSPALAADASQAAQDVAGLTLDPPAPEADASQGMGMGDESFFDNLPSPSPKSKEPPPGIEEQVALAEAAGTQNGVGSPVGDGAVVEDEADVSIKNALFVGNYEGAVQACIDADKMADALIIASVGGVDLWARTKQEYLKRSTKGYMKIVLSIVDNNLESIVAQQSPSKWRETLALLCTYAQADQWFSLCSLVGDSLVAARDVEAALLCYICAGNLDKAVGLWSGSLDLAREKERLYDIMEKASILYIGTGQQASDVYGNLLNSYADLLASTGHMNEALDFLNSIPGELAESTTMFKNRLSQAGAKVASEVAYSAQAQADAANAYAFQGVGAAAYQQSDYSQATAYDPSGYQQPQQASYQGGQQYASGGYQEQASYNNNYAMPPPQQPAYQTNNQYNSQPAAAPYTQPSAQYSQSTGGGGQQPQAQQYYQPDQPQQYGNYAPISPPVDPAPAPQPPSIFNPMAAQARSPPSQAPSVFNPGQQAGGMQQPPMQGGGAAQAPAEKKPAAPAAPHIPANVSIDNVDITKVGANLKPVIDCLKASFSMCAQAYQGNPSKKREIDDNSRRLGILFFKLNANDIKASVKAQLIALCQALSARDFAQASRIHINLTTTDFDECGQWLTALKRLIKTRQAIGQ